MGSFEVEVRLAWPHDLPGDRHRRTARGAAGDAGRNSPGTKLADHQRQFGRRVQPVDESWEIEEVITRRKIHHRRPTSAPAADRLTADSIRNLGVPSRKTARGLGTTVVQRAWIQSWVSAGSPRSRPIALPAPPMLRANASVRRVGDKCRGPAGSSVVDSGVGSQWNSDRQIATQQWPAPRAGIAPSVGRSWRASQAIEVEPPRFASSVWVQHTLWQLVLPGDEHLLSVPLNDARVHLELVRLGLDPAGVMGTGGTGKWIEQLRKNLLPEATNRYLFSVMGNPAKLAKRPRPLAGRLFSRRRRYVLSIGLLLMYVPIARRPWAMIAAV